LFAARNAAQVLIDDNPDLIKQENQLMKLFIDERAQQKLNWSKIA
jgi:hypothetical protein